MDDKEKAHVEAQLKADFIEKGGNEADWESSREKNEFLADIFTNPASGDEAYRAGEYSYRHANTIEEMAKKATEKAKSRIGVDWDKMSEEDRKKEIDKEMEELKIANNQREDAQYNISEEISFRRGNKGSLVDSEKRIAEEEKNPWASNAGIAEPEEAPKFIDIDTSGDLTGDKPRAYRRITKGRLGGTE
ncbi:MAG: hypothetical protein EOM67_14275 [Spirochaetia bacterium]|nr:hypothetical protein [Spirochaetia bacterium]